MARGKWELYNLADDLGETRDLYDQAPEIVAELEAYWQQYKQDNNVIEPDWVSGY